MTDHRLGTTLRLGLRWNGIHFSRIEKIDALGQRIIHLLESLSLRILFTPGHRTEADG